MTLHFLPCKKKLMVPYKVLNILKWIVEKDSVQQAEAELQAGRDRYQHIKKVEASRSKRLGPYC